MRLGRLWAVRGRLTMTGTPSDDHTEAPEAQVSEVKRQARPRVGKPQSAKAQSRSTGPTMQAYGRSNRRVFAREIP
jgi:hypothetical protein